MLSWLKWIEQKKRKERLVKVGGVPNTAEKRNADPNPKASPSDLVSGVCIRK